MSKFQIVPENVKRIYVGADRACRCGCKGKYHDVGSRGFKLAMIRLDKLSLDDVLEVDVDSSNVNISLENNRAMTFYFD